MDTVCEVASLAAEPDEQLCPERLVDDLIEACPHYRPGTRPIHAPGIGATGWFSATTVASSLTLADHFQGARVPVAVRFSNGTGDKGDLDSDPLPRGMAVKFHLGNVHQDDGGVLTSDVTTDLISMTLPMFFVDRIEGFPEFVRAATPVRVQRRSRWSSVVSAVRLETPPTPPVGTDSNGPGIFKFARRHHQAAPAVAFLAAGFVPEGYTTCSYHAVHTFGLEGPDGVTRWARFHWEPVDGVRGAPPGIVGNFLRQGLRDRIVNGHAEFVLRIQLAEQGDNVGDPTTPWPTRRQRVVMGHLRLTDIPTDQVNGCELLAFNPTRLIPGITLSDDRILAARRKVYSYSYERRRHAYEAAAQPLPI